MDDAFLKDFLLFAELLNEPRHENRIRWSKFRKSKLSTIVIDGEFAAEFSEKGGDAGLLNALKEAYVKKRSRSRTDILLILHGIILEKKGTKDLESFLSAEKYEGGISEYSIPEDILTEFQKEIVFDLGFDIKKEYRTFLNDALSVKHEGLRKAYLAAIPYLKDGPTEFSIGNFFIIPFSKRYVLRVLGRAMPAAVAAIMGIAGFNMASNGNNFLESIVWAYLGLILSGILFDAKAYGWKGTVKNLGLLALLGILIDRFASNGGIYGIMTLLLFVSPLLSIGFGFGVKFFNKLDAFDTYSSILYLATLAMAIAVLAGNRGLLMQFKGTVIGGILIIGFILFVNYKIIEFFRPKSNWLDSRAKNSQIRAEFWEHRKNGGTLSEKEFKKLSQN